MTGTRVGAAVACLLAGAAVAAVLLAWPPPAAQPTACDALDELAGALALDTLGDQAAVLARAAELADLVDDPGAPVDGARVAGRIRALLEDPTATVEQLVATLAPVAATCDIPLRLDTARPA